MQFLIDHDTGVMTLHPTTDADFALLQNRIGVKKDGDQVVLTRKDIDVMTERGRGKSFVLESPAVALNVTPPKPPPVIPESIEIEEDE